MSTATSGTAGTPASGDLPVLVMPSPYTSVAARVQDVAARRPDRLALTSGDADLTYAGLQRHMDDLARQLVAVLPDGGSAEREPVGILAEQGVDSVAAFLAVMAAGHPAVLIDVSLPPARMAQITELAGVRVVLADEQRLQTAQQLAGVTTVRGLTPVEGAPAVSPEELPAITLDDPATLVFTSGTTGLPKGVVWTQRTFLACGHTSRETLRVTEDDRISLILPQGFAVGQLSIASAVLNGATLCIRDPRARGVRDLGGWLESTGVTVLNCTPSLLRSLHGALPERHVLEQVRLVTTAGEKVFGADVADFRQHLGPQASFMNWMGSSETEALTSFEIRPGDPLPEGAVPTGRGIPLRELSILGPDDEPVPPGEVGVLHATSSYFSAGYWRAPEQTATRFRREPDGRTRYCTGDRARMSADGIVEILGRGDDSVKIRGYLVEPAEVESSLRRLPTVLDAVVRGAGADDDVRLVAWVVADPHQPAPTDATLRSELGALLPEWMVPRDVVLLPELPRNENGKVDVKSLPEPPERREIEPPVTDAERAVARVWAKVLGLEEVGRSESFTALGGESLGVEEMFAALEPHFGVPLLAEDLVNHPTLADFAAHLEARRSAGADQRAGRPERLGAAGRLIGGLVRGARDRARRR